MLSDQELSLQTARLSLEPVKLSHAQELYDLFKDPELHRFVDFETPTYEEQLARSTRWSNYRSPDGTEAWYNWVARESASGAVVGSFQTAIRPDGTASIGYLVARASQGQGFATEALRAVLDLLFRQGVKTVEATVTAGNLASIRAAEKIGMKQALVIRNSVFFKGASHDEVVFQMELSARGK